MVGLRVVVIYTSIIMEEYMEINKVRQAVKKSTNFGQVLSELGFSPTNTTQRLRLLELMHRSKIDYSHFNNKRGGKWSDISLLTQLVRKSDSMGEFLTLMGLAQKGSNYAFAKRKLLELNIDTSSWSRQKKGKSYLTIPLEEILQGKHPSYSRFSLKQRLLKEGIKSNKCEECGMEDTWNGKPINMHLDHVNGKHDDHRLSNLRMICPNCHSQTETYGGKNK